MTIKLNRIFASGIAAVAMSAALVAGTPAQAESRTFIYGTLGSAKYEGVAPTHLRKSFNRSYKRAFKSDRRALRANRSHSKRNFHGKTRIRISR